jgi:mannose-6-phosphate isomerase-like protein (cupin superfamily)
MANAARRPGVVDEVQTFTAPRSQSESHVDMAMSPNSHISTIQVDPHGETPIPAKESDEILVVVNGTCIAETAAGSHALHEGQGFLLPLGMPCRIRNESDAPVNLLSMLTKRTSPYDTNVVSDVIVRFPAELVSGLGLGSKLYAYVMDRRTIGISPLIMEEWNQASALRMNCKFRREGDTIVATLPERVVRWYGLDDLRDGDYTVTHDRRRSRVRVDLTPLIARRANRP